MKKHLKGPSYRGPGVRTESRTQAALLLPELSPNVILQASRSPSETWEARFGDYFVRPQPAASRET